MTTAKHLAIVAALALSPAVAVAQDSTTEFRLALAPGSIQGCMRLDSSMSQVHTLTIKDGQASIKSAGGINDKLKMTEPKIYKDTFQLGGARLDIVADLAATPKSLTASNRELGCKWTATAP
jgi:hypothetical protein